MRYIDEYRAAPAVRALVAEIGRTVTRPWTIMEICGGQTHAILRFGLDALLPPGLTLLHGPGCPVCVTPARAIDEACRLALRPDTLLCSYGDMLRVPGSRTHLASMRAAGGAVRTVYAPFDALALARRHPDKEVVFFAIGFETTVPAHAAVVLQARAEGLANFSLLTAQFRVPPAMEAILSAPNTAVQAFLAAGHVCAVMGLAEYEPVARNYHTPIVATGFEPVDLLEGILAAVRRLEAGQAHVWNAYARVVRPEGAPAAREMMNEVFEQGAATWRGLGVLPQSGWVLRSAFARFDARVRLGAVAEAEDASPAECIAGDILRGAQRPVACPLFGSRCTPAHPCGAPMVSTEGICAAYYLYKRTDADVAGRGDG